MNAKKTTVSVERIEGLPAVRMTWQHNVNSRDVSDAFKAITAFLNDGPDGQYVVVDLRENPNFPLAATINGALFGPYRNPKLREWLVIGSNSLARVIERTLASVTRRSNVRWFKTEEEVVAYIRGQMAASDG